MTVLEVVNKVLKRLREDTVTASDAEEYSSLIAEFVADIHSECVEQHDWSSMNHYINLELVPGQRTYNLGEGGVVDDAERETNNDSHLIFDARNRPMAFLFDDENDQYGEQIFACSVADMDRLFQLDRQMENEQPYHISYNLAPGNEGVELNVWPLPAASRLLRLKFWTPPLILGDGSDDNTELLMPWRPVYLGALYLALNERGEEIGEPGNIAEQRYLRARSSAIESDLKLGTRSDQYEAVRD